MLLEILASVSNRTRQLRSVNGPRHRWRFSRTTRSVKSFVLRPSANLSFLLALPFIMFAVGSLELRQCLALDFFQGGGNTPLWSNPANWSSGVPGLNAEVVILPNRTVVFDVQNARLQSLVINGVFNVKEDAGVVRRLSSNYIMVHGVGSAFNVGSQDNPYGEGAAGAGNGARFEVTLEGDNPMSEVACDYENRAQPGMCPLTVNGSPGNNAFLMAMEQGSISMFGRTKTKMQRLRKTAQANDVAIDLVSLPSNWEVDDTIAIASTGIDPANAETAVIQNLNPTANRITLRAGLKNRHFGSVELETFTLKDDPTEVNAPPQVRTLNERAEVVNLTRSIVIQGDDDANGAGAEYGGNLMFHTDPGRIMIDGVQFFRMGQQGRIGRYPVHWHRVGNGGTNDFISNCVILNSFNRAITIHRTNNVKVLNNTAYAIAGHAFFLEDATETGNEFIGNIGMSIRRPSAQAGKWTLLHDVFARNQKRNPDGSADGENVEQRFVSPATFWISNPDNTFRDNISAGCDGTGFWFALPETALRDKFTGVNEQSDNGIVPSRTQLREFSGNMSHSSPVGLTADQGENIASNIGHTVTTFWDPLEIPANPDSAGVSCSFREFTAYHHSGCAIYLRNRSPQAGGKGDLIVNGAVISDCKIGTFVTYNQLIRNSIYVGACQNNGDPNRETSAHKLYDGASSLSNVAFFNYKSNAANVFVVNGGAEKRFLAKFANLKFDAESLVRVGITKEGTQMAADGINEIMSVFEDTTGNVSGVPGSVIVPDHPFVYNKNGDVLLRVGTANTPTKARRTNNVYAGLRLDAVPSVNMPTGRIIRISPNAPADPSDNAVIAMENSAGFPERTIAALIIREKTPAGGTTDPRYIYRVEFDRTPPKFRVSMTDALNDAPAGSFNTHTTIVHLMGVGANAVFTHNGVGTLQTLSTLAALRNASPPAVVRDGPNLYVKLAPVRIGPDERKSNVEIDPR